MAPRDGNLPGSSVQGISQVRILTAENKEKPRGNKAEFHVLDGSLQTHVSCDRGGLGKAELWPQASNTLITASAPPGLKALGEHDDAQGRAKEKRKGGYAQELIRVQFSSFLPFILQCLLPPLTVIMERQERFVGFYLSVQVFAQKI